MILHKKFLVDQIYVIQLETNAKNVEHVQAWVNNKIFNHMQHVALGTLVIMTENIDLKVGVTNGTIGIVTNLEFNLQYNVCSIYATLNPLGYMQIVWKNQFKTNMILKDIFIELHFL